MKQPDDDDDDTYDVVEKRVLSLQSHVVHGYVGNKAAVFPLQLLGFEVDVVNTVQFSNHTGYSSWGGKKMDGEELCALMDGLDANSLLDSYTHLLTGYAGSESFLKTIVSVAKRLKAKCSDLLYICDPVMGDNDKLYVPKELVKIYSEEVVPLANILLPNQFESEMLTGMKIRTQEDALKVCEKLHDRGPSIVVITSLTLKESKDKSIVMILSHRDKDHRNAYAIRVPRIDGYFTGTGDLTASLMLGYLGKGYSSKRALEMTASSVHAVLKRTSRHEAKLAKIAIETCRPRTRRPSRTIPPPELRLIQSQKELRSPPSLLHAELIYTNDDRKS